ncbi:MAG: hypothetical protein N2Z84_05610, partial [Atribacterota bacterium]|nr:hypothetical protein [Atribacterota bacterium]
MVQGVLGWTVFGFRRKERTPAAAAKGCHCGVEAMFIARGWKNHPQQRIIALGFFDGLHRGHQEVLRHAYRSKAFEREVVEVVTFYPHPQNFLAGKGNRSLKYLTSYGEKYCLMQHFFPGIFLRFIRFDAVMRSMEPEAFLRLIYSQLFPCKIFVGENFRFGYRAAGDITLLQRYFRTRSVEVMTIPSLKDDGVCISSSGIRTLLIQGDLHRVNSLLGYRFTIMGRVGKGRKLGSELGFPTANLYPSYTKILPPHGVYISHVSWEGLKDWFPALTYIGRKPTLGGSRRRVVETFVPAFRSLDLYRRRMVVQLVAFVREERVFSSVQELKKQIGLDLEAFYRYLQGSNGVVNYPLNAIL